MIIQFIASSGIWQSAFSRAYKIEKAHREINPNEPKILKVWSKQQKHLPHREVAFTMAECLHHPEWPPEAEGVPQFIKQCG
jgi:hypothetical protein